MDELAQRMPVLSEEVQSSFVGGGCMCFYSRIWMGSFSWIRRCRTTYF